MATFAQLWLTALLEFKHRIIDPESVLASNWTISSSVCNWSGVSCGVIHERVVALNLPDMNLTAVIPPHLGNLSFLVSLDLSGNSFYGHMPRELGQLHRLRLMDLSFNGFNSEIPSSIGKCSSLLSLKLYYNELSGVMLGEIPEESGNLLCLETLFMQHTKGLTGRIPTSIFNISTLIVITYSNDSLSGNLPDDLCRHLPILRELYLYGNKLSGNIPSSINECYSLQLLELSANRFTGLIPKRIFNSTTLQAIHIFDNNLEGTIPPLTNAPMLWRLQLWGNKLSGNIPSSISNASMLEIFDVGDNFLSGLIPKTVGNLRHLEILQVANNHLTTKSATHEWSFRSSLVNCKNLNLHVNSNDLISTIPSTLWDLKDILELDFSSNYLNNSHTPDVGHFRSLLHLKLSRNLLTGDISSTFGGLQTLVTLDLSNNIFHGHIPGSLGGLISLEFLDLCNNNLSGVIPESLEKLSYLLYFNVSFNRLEGEIPTNGCFTSFSRKSFMENYALCGPPRLLVPPCKGSIHRNSNKTRLHALRYGLPTIGIVLFLIVLIVMYRRCQSRNTTRLVKDDLLSLEIRRRRISHAEFSQATGGFDESEMLGFRSFG
ncbi:receptor-like protein kinase 2 [Hibiscus syriacus]|uniref:receptor-like protein kinase 2 n=1 Tax=Hibiscus syriacus TaxID=106335 RepID=UPI0019211573|nr:receptor-like protein kinase 2 [Hibiscus syriacus]